jgi:two-component system chemotaxis sensor kinase CheA
VIVNVGARRIALLVDDLLGGEETVIKPLDAFLHRSVAVAGATITGDGSVRLLLDPAALLELVDVDPNPRAQGAHV